MVCRTSPIYLTPFAIVQQLATLASLHNKDYVYPKEKIGVSWEKALLNQCEYPEKLTTFKANVILQSMMVNFILVGWMYLN